MTLSEGSNKWEVPGKANTQARRLVKDEFGRIRGQKAGRQVDERATTENTLVASTSYMTASPGLHGQREEASLWSKSLRADGARVSEQTPSRWE